MACPLEQEHKRHEKRKEEEVSDQSLTIQKELPAPPETVFEAWTTPEHMAQWFSPMTTASVPKLELREGGEYQIDMHGEDHDFVHVGKYLKIDRPNELVFTWVSDGTQQVETVVTLRLEPRGNGTLLTLIHDKMPSAEATENHRMGWTAIANKLEEVLAKTAQA